MCLIVVLFGVRSLYSFVSGNLLYKVYVSFPGGNWVTIQKKNIRYFTISCKGFLANVVNMDC